MPAKDENIALRCYTCGDDMFSSSHYSSTCPLGKSLCFRCKQPGHWVRDCPQQLKCFGCGDVGHFRARCPRRTCFKCGQVGHSAQECATARPEPLCDICGNTGHIAYACPTRPQPEQATEEPKKPCSETQDHHKHTQSQSNEEGYSDRTKNKHGKGRSEDSEKLAKSQIDHDLALAIEECARVIASHQLAAEGNVAYRDENFVLAINKYTQAIALSNREESYYSRRAAAYMKLKKYKHALVDLQRVILLQGDNPKPGALVLLGKCQYFLGAASSAQSYFGRALALDPDNGLAKYFRTKAHELQTYISNLEGARSGNRWRVAQLSFEKCIQTLGVNSDDDLPGEWRCWKLEIDIALGNWDAAQKITSDIIDPTDSAAADLTCLRALILFLLGDLSNAKIHVFAALRLDPDNTKAKQLRTRINSTHHLKKEGNDAFKGSEWLVAISKYDEALQFVGESVEEGQGGHMRAILLSNRAMAYMKIQQYHKAMTDVKTSIALTPTFFKALRTRARINVLDENFESAIKDFKLALEHAVSPSERQAVQTELDRLLAKIDRDKKKNHYEILGLSRLCSTADIRKAYREASLKHHPDKGGSEEKFKKISAAYSILCDPLQRARYDAGINAR